MVKVALKISSRTKSRGILYFGKFQELEKVALGVEFLAGFRISKYLAFNQFLEFLDIGRIHHWSHKFASQRPQLVVLVVGLCVS